MFFIFFNVIKETNNERWFNNEDENKNYNNLIEIYKKKSNDNVINKELYEKIKDDLRTWIYNHKKGNCKDVLRIYKKVCAAGFTEACSYKCP